MLVIVALKNGLNLGCAIRSPEILRKSVGMGGKSERLERTLTTR